MKVMKLLDKIDKYIKESKNFNQMSDKELLDWIKRNDTDEPGIGRVWYAN